MTQTECPFDVPAVRAAFEDIVKSGSLAQLNQSLSEISFAASTDNMALPSDSIFPLMLVQRFVTTLIEAEVNHLKASRN